MTPAALIYNPVAGRQRALRLLAPLLKNLHAAGYAAQPLATASAGHAAELARQAARDGAEAVFALGGDGTQRETAMGLVGSEAALGVLSGGTTNVLARALGLPLDPLQAAALAGRLERRPFDVGLCNGEPFLMMASLGLDGRVLVHQNPRLKAWLGRGALATGAVREWWRYHYPAFEVVADGRAYEATFAAVCNIPLYGGGFRLAPSADFSDRRLDVVLFRGRDRLTTLAFAAGLAAGRHLRRGDVECFEAEEVRFAAEEGLRFQVDGDPHCAADGGILSLADAPLQVLVNPSAGSASAGRR